MGKHVVEHITDFNLEHIFDCGQCFRWEKQENGSYTGTAFGKVVNMQFIEDDKEKGSAFSDDLLPSENLTTLDGTQPCGDKENLNGAMLSESLETLNGPLLSKSLETLNGALLSKSLETLNGALPSGRLVIDNCTEAEFEQIWKPYLDLERDYGEIKGTLTARDQVMKQAVECGQGIRILKQDLWETIVSFIISQNNNIPRIKGCIENLSNLFGQPAGEYAGRAYYSVPGPQKVASLTAEELAPVRLGYRARYLVETAKMVCEKGLPENEEQLAALCGVGPKVANCIMLFGMGRYDSFPIDVWMARVMNQLYGMDEKDHKGMCSYAKEHFGQLGGFAQQYLFYYIREKNK